MKFDREIEAFIKDFVKDLLESNVAIFAGAGMSKGAGYVDWPELLRDIADELGLQIEKEHDLISLAQYHVNHRGSPAGIVKKILEEFTERAELTENHRILARLPIPIYWTTNYDTLLEDSLRAAFKVVDIKHEIDHLANTRPKRDVVVYKMHGDAHTPTRAILTKSQYETYYKTHEPFITALSGDLVSRTFLFIGFSFTDPNLDYVLSKLHVKTSSRQHYCFMKRESQLPGEDHEIFAYKQRKQELKILDLKRYRIKAILVDDYADITNVLHEIERRYKKQTIFISGSAEQYGTWGRESAQKLIHLVSNKMISANFRIINGFGWGVGSAVINGALEAIYNNPDKYSEEQLVIRPFPQFETSTRSLADLWEEYRQRMISLAGIAVFIFGNKSDGSGGIINANGVIREFHIALEQGAIPIPIGSTEYASKEIFNLIESDPDKYYGDTASLILPVVKELNSTTDPTQIAQMVISLITKINR